jgi:hypothetical protein
MNPQILAAVFFPDVFQCRIISPSMQWRVQWYTCTKFADDPAAYIIRIVNWSSDIWSQKTHFMVNFGRTAYLTRFVLLLIHKIHLTKTQSLAVPLQLHVKSQTVSFFSFPLKHLNEFIIAHRACCEAHLLYTLWFGYANKTNNPLQMYNFTIHTAMCFSFSRTLLTQTAQWTVCLRSLPLPHSVCYLHV